MPNDSHEPRRGNHFGGSQSNYTPRASQSAGPSETAEFTSAYFASAKRNASSEQTTSDAQVRRSVPRAEAPVRRTAQGYNPADGVNAIPYGGSGDGSMGTESSYNPQPSHKKNDKGKVIAGVIAAVVAVIVVVGGICGFSMYSDYKNITAKVPTLTEQASTLKDSVMAGDGEAVRTTAASISSEVSGMNDTLNGLPWQLASLMPVVGQDVQSARTLVSEADRLCQYALIPACDSLADVKLSNLVSDGAINVDLLESLVATLQNVSPVIQQSAETIEALPEARIDKVGELITKVQDLVRTADGAITSVNEVSPYLPQMLGGDGVRNYLLIAQTNSEVRSCGGLPGSMGVLTIANGTISLGEFEAGAKLEHYDTPSFGVTDEEVALFSGVGTAPTSTTLIPDFQRAASILCQIWTNQKGGTLDGAVAIDPVFLQKLLALTGGFTAADGTAVNGDNCARLLLHDAYRNMDISQTDEFFSSVADMAFDNVLGNLGNIDLTTFFETVMSSIETRQVQVYMANPDEENVMVKIGCSGNINSDETKPEVGVYLNDFTWSKISWYLSVNTQTGEGTKNADGTTTYHVTTTIKNNLTPEEAEGLVDYITGYNSSKRDLTDMLNIVYIFAPAGGTISNMVYTDDSGNQGSINEATYNGRQLFTNTASTIGGGQCTYTYDVTVSANAVEPLGVDTTPTAQSVAGWQ